MKSLDHLEAWKVSETDFPADGASDEKLWFILKYAILAPSSHNTQPWRFGVQGSQVELYADLSRGLRIVDPNYRELIVSCGGALFHLLLGIRYFGYSSRYEIFPSGDDCTLLARVQLGFKHETDTEDVLLFNAIPKRRTNRLPFRPEPVPEALLCALEAAAAREGAWLHILRDEEDRYQLSDLVAEADRAQWSNKQFRQELVEWIHPTRHLRNDGIPGYAQGVGNFISYPGPFVIRTFDLGKGRAAKDREIALHSPVLAVLGSDTDTQRGWLATGQALARVLLRARMEDVWASFLNQAIEVESVRPKVAAITGRSGFPQLILRLGFGDEVKPTPRRSVAEVLLPRSKPYHQRA